MKTKDLKRGDGCPACHGELRAAYVPSDDEFRKAQDRENPIALPRGADTATPEQRAELGELHVCRDCGYKTRFPADEAKHASVTDQTAQGATSGHEPSRLAGA